VRLAQRLLVGSLVVVGVILILVVTLSERGLRAGLISTTTERMVADARLLASLWRPGTDPDSLADASAAALGLRVTLIDSSGTVVGDSEFDGLALTRVENHGARPEILAARARGTGTDVRVSPSIGEEALYFAVQAPLGFARVAISTAAAEQTIARARSSVVAAGAIGALAAMLLALVFARAVSRPVVELSEVAQAIAAGDLSRRPSLSAPGEVGDLAAALHRMTEQLASRLAAVEAEDLLLGAVIDALNEAVVAVDARRQVVRVNIAARRLLGIRGAVPFSADNLPRDAVLRDALSAALEGESVDAVELVIEGHTIALTARPLSRGGGAVLAALDLTDVRRLETIRRDFVANVSHELKTPLTVIGGFAETLAEPGVPAAQRETFARTILTNVRRMQRIVDDLLDLSRIESGGWVPAPVRVDVASIAAEAMSSCRQTADDKGVALSVAVGPQADSLHADPTAVRQIISNLVQNAVRYTPRAGHVTVFSERDDGNGVWIGVRDTGIGIAPEHVSRIFERFYRIDSARSREDGGTGLGLSIVRHLAEAHGGRVRAESAPGRGTTIAAFFPSEPTS
jgi:two-component system, OmpR family, phosphate regulon sensor histidine kinase PhoR